MDQHIATIASLARRPGMYVGSTSLRDVSAFLNGYMVALDRCGVLPNLAIWGMWIGARFGIWHTAWSWERTLLHSYGSEEAAISALPELFRCFVEDARELGVAGIEARHRERFGQVGAPPCIPAFTFTKNPL